MAESRAAIDVRKFSLWYGDFQALHDIDLIQRYATRLIALRDGRVVYEGSPESFDKQTFRRIYGEEAESAVGLAESAEEIDPRS